MDTRAAGLQMPLHDAGDAALFRAAIDASPSGIVVVDAAGAIALVNRALARLFGYTPDELVGQSIELLVPDRERLSHAAHRDGFSKAPERRPMGAGRDLYGQRKDGSLVPIEIGLSPLVTPDGRWTLASVVETTERQRATMAHEAPVEDQREFEHFIADLSTRMIDLPATQMNDAIREALGQICGRHGIDRATLFALTAEGMPHDVVGWSADGVPPMPEDPAVASGFPWMRDRLLAGEDVVFARVDELPSATDRASCHAFGTRSAMAFPLSVENQVVGAVWFNTVLDERIWPAVLEHRLRVLAGVVAQALARHQRDEALRCAFAEVERLKNELQLENAALRRQVDLRVGPSPVIGRSHAVAEVLEQVRQVAPTGSTVLLLGETGVGKELLAQQVHQLSPRAGRPMVRVNCAAIPATLIESELFGREKGAFTGALARQIGRFELADGSTIFLDEIGDLPADVQVKLLRVLENGQIERLGSPRAIPVDTRIIAATHRNLEQRITEGAFRADLYYRLNVFPIRVPPLRERPEDIPALVWRFVEEFATTFGKHVDAISDSSMAALQRYSWPGNVRELRNVVERAMITASGPKLTITTPNSTASAGRHSTKLSDVEREHVRSVLDACGWRIRGGGGAAERLGLKPTTLETRMAKLGLRRPAARD
jgi:PAS domain S-box-containing protein